eukprot:gene9293-10898_t
MKSKIQPVIIILGLFSLFIGARQMLDVPTMILPSWFLLLTSLPCILGGSFVLGYLTKKMMNSKWRTITFASVFITAFCSIYYISQYKITYKITIPENYAGEVRLFVSNERGNDFLINHYGVGYINQETFILILLASCTGKVKFDKNKWDESIDPAFPSDFRDKMLPDLITNHKLIGLTCAQLVEKLGQPNNKENNTMSYNIIVDYGYDIDPVHVKHLTFSYSKDSLIRSYKITEWKH